MASDDFTNTNGTSLTDHDDGVSGVTWGSIGTTGSANTLPVGSFEIQSNECHSTAAFDEAGARNTESTDVNFSEGIIKAHAHDEETVSYCFQSTTTRRGYYTQFTSLAGDVFGVVNLREDDGSADNFRSGETEGNDNSWDRTNDIKVTIREDSGNVDVYIDDVLEIRWAEGSPLSGGEPGFFNTGAMDVVSQFDDWTDGVAGNIVIPVPTGPLW